jgi:hypothetical protein
MQRAPAVADLGRRLQPAGQRHRARAHRLHVQTFPFLASVHVDLRRRASGEGGP